MTHGGTTKPLINALLQPAKHAIPRRWKWECLYRLPEVFSSGGERWKQIGRGGGELGVKHCSPSLVSHAPRLSHAALLPHFDYACEGLHTWLPLGDQRDLSLHTHVGPGRKMVIKTHSHRVKNTESCCYICADACNSKAQLSAALPCMRWCNLSWGVGPFVMSGFWYFFFFLKRLRGNSSYITEQQRYMKLPVVRNICQHSGVRQTKRFSLLS